MITVGTKSILFGAHAFWFHPIVVWLAWRKFYGRCPNFWECIAIATHDLSYWGKSSMDGPDGILHPYGGARIGKAVARFFGARECEALYVESLILGHSRSFCAQENKPISDLCPPDKLSILFEPKWWYWLRTELSGEVHEFRRNEEQKQNRRFASTWAWQSEYRQIVKAQFGNTK